MVYFWLEVRRFWEASHHEYEMDLLFLSLYLRDQLLDFAFDILKQSLIERGHKGWRELNVGSSFDFHMELGRMFAVVLLY